MADKTLLLLCGILLAGFGLTRLIYRKKGKVTVKDGVAYAPSVMYRFNQDDLTWLARAIHGEAGTNAEGGAAVAWTALNNFMLVIGNAGRRPRFPAFWECIRAYSSVLSPRWATLDAPGCREHPENCTQSQLRRRREITAMSWDRIPTAIRELVLRFSRGELKNPVGNAVDWASFGFDGAERRIAGNYFGKLPFRRLV